MEDSTVIFFWSKALSVTRFLYWLAPGLSLKGRRGGNCLQGPSGSVSALRLGGCWFNTCPSYINDYENWYPFGKFHSSEILQFGILFCEFSKRSRLNHNQTESWHVLDGTPLEPSVHNLNPSIHPSWKVIGRLNSMKSPETTGHCQSV